MSFQLVSRLQPSRLQRTEKSPYISLNGLQVVTWHEGWWIYDSDHSWDQAQYVGGNVGRYVLNNLNNGEYIDYSGINRVMEVTNENES